MFALLAPDTFVTTENAGVIARAAAVTMLVGVAQMVVIGSGGMNLAVGAIGGLAAVTSGWLMQDNGVSAMLAFLIGVVVGLACGLVSGGLIAFTGMSPFVVTLATASVFTGINLGFTRSEPFADLPQPLREFGNGTWLGVPLIFLVGIVICAALGVLFRWTTLGQQILALGGSPRAAELTGVPRKGVQLFVYALSGALSACAGFLLIARLGSAQPTAGSDWLLISFAAPIIGGVLLSGGYVTVSGTVAGALLLTVLANGLVHMRVDPYFVQLLSGLIILLAAMFDRFRGATLERQARMQRRLA